MNGEMIFEFLLVPLIVWNMWQTNKSATTQEVQKEKISELSKEVEDLKKMAGKVTALENSNDKIFETVGSIKADLHDIRNFLVRVITKDDPDKIKDLVDTMMPGK